MSESDITPQMNLALLTKLLKMTTSTNDGEALTAMRAANRQVERLGTTWDDLMSGRVTIVADPFAGGSPMPEVARDTQRAPPQYTPRGAQYMPQPFGGAFTGQFGSGSAPKPPRAQRPAAAQKPTAAAPYKPRGPKAPIAKGPLPTLDDLGI